MLAGLALLARPGLRYFPGVKNNKDKRPGRRFVIHKTATVKLKKQNIKSAQNASSQDKLTLNWFSTN